MAWSDIGDSSPGDILTAAKIDAARSNFRAIGDPWASYTPLLSQGGTVTKTVTYAKWISAGKLTIVNVRLDVTGAGTTANGITVSLPATAATTNLVIGSGLVFDATSGANGNVCAVRQASSSTLVDFIFDGSAVALGNSFALASGDVIQFHATYEAA